MGCTGPPPLATCDLRLTPSSSQGPEWLGKKDCYVVFTCERRREQSATKVRETMGDPCPRNEVAKGLLLH